jgi:hypothetical protein
MVENSEDQGLDDALRRRLGAGMKSKIFLLVALLIPSLCFGSTSKELAQKGRLFYEAFECSHLARIAGDKNESMRLFEVGMREGRIFIEASKKNQISEEDARANIPMIVLWSLSKESTEFTLGVIWKEAEKAAIESAFGSYEKYIKNFHDKDLTRAMASGTLRKRNAWLIK